MANTDYDKPRQTVTEEDSLEELQSRRATTSQSGVIDVDETELADSFVLPGDQLDEELTVTVVPMQADEFRCTSCFLVRHRSQLASASKELCVDCA